MKPRPVVEPSRPSGVEIEVRAARGHADLPPIVLPGEPASVRDAWAACWAYADEHGAGERAVALVAWLAVSRRFPVLIRAEILERIRGISYADRPPS